MIDVSTTTGGNQIVLYKAEDGTVQMDVRLQDETIWLTQKMMAELFDVESHTITYHLGEIYGSDELQETSTHRKIRAVQKEGGRDVSRELDFYNLDAILSVGYRINSKRGTQFRIWATTVLRKHLIDGYTLHQKRLQERGTQELEQALALISRAKSLPELSPDEAKGLLDIVTGYAQTWLLLRKFDEKAMEVPAKLRKPTYVLTYTDATVAILSLKKNLASSGEASDLFGIEQSKMFRAIIGNIRQTFDAQELYPTIEQKAAHLLYFIIKDHPFVDGNKRIAVLLFLTFLQRNDAMPRTKELPASTLVALALLIAESDPKEKEAMLRLILHFIASP